jgi:hypothetical protein
MIVDEDDHRGPPRQGPANRMSVFSRVANTGRSNQFLLKPSTLHFGAANLQG